MSAAVAAPRTCIACGGWPRARFRLSNGAWLRQCPRCQLGWWDWPPFEPADFYDSRYFQSDGERKGYDNYAALEAGVTRTATTRLRRIAELRGATHTEPQRLFEIGCGSGVFLDRARRAGWEVQGIEVSAYAADQSRQRGFDVRTCAVETLAPTTAAHDCVAMWDVIEHLRDPARALRTAGQMLRPGGILALSTGDVTSFCARLSGPRWHLYNVPEHLFFFSPAALARLLRRAGFCVRRVTREVNWVPVAYVLERLQKAHGLSWPVLRRALGPAAARRILDAVVPATLGDVLGVYAVRVGPGSVRTARLAEGVRLR